MPDGSFDVVYSSHNLEHLYTLEVPVALREMRRQLRDGGQAAGNLYMAHRCGFTETTLRNALLNSSFAATISLPAALDLWTLGFKALRTQAQAMEAVRRFLPIALPTG